MRQQRVERIGECPDLAYAVRVTGSAYATGHTYSDSPSLVELSAVQLQLVRIRFRKE
jgi:hypothetical protein